MAGGASPPRRASSANTSFLDGIDDPHGDYARMGKEESSSYSPRGYTESDMEDYDRMKKLESSSYSPKGYTKRDMTRIKDLIGEDHASDGDCIASDSFEKTRTKTKSSIRKGRSNKRKKGAKKGAKEEIP